MNDCPFCELAHGRIDAELIVLRTSRTFVVPALKQRRLNRGHMLVVPATHVTRLIDAEAGLLEDLYTVAGRVSMALREVFGASGAILFQGDESPEQIPHLHIHVIPRRAGDDFKLPDAAAGPVSYEERRQQAVEMRRALEG